MQTISEKLFFRYEQGLTNKYSEEFLISLTSDIPYYSKTLQTHHQSFLTFLQELPKTAFFKFCNELKNDGELEALLDHENIKKRVTKSRKSPIVQTIIEQIKGAKEINCVKDIGGNCFLVEIDKHHPKYAGYNDFLLTFQRNKIKLVPIANPFQKEKYIEKTYKKRHLKNKEQFCQLIKKLEKENRMGLLFVS